MDHPRLGRRGACTLFYASIALVIGAGALWPSVATAASLYGNLCAMAAFNVIYVHTAELWPTKLRASALGLCSAAGKLGSFFSSPLPGILGSTATLAVISAMYLCFLLAAASPLASALRVAPVVAAPAARASRSSPVSMGWEWITEAGGPQGDKFKKARCALAASARGPTPKTGVQDDLPNLFSKENFEEFEITPLMIAAAVTGGGSLAVVASVVLA
ncbi:hypothetical protein EMIHUDRAFT_208366 [Emiliania huxleyi CCMP1516]|uniref:Major facilitator superfamily (MFS) profile domain-containing protein n=2 Tax=Emiliania huxleyi TaxID=2903 RepID=A0A0D3JAF4_EMIH1|nr:hypothetical protein EMIHUDRAFT_208366 [Emiliania huxleyi CCMP1516]EOD20489.1 hypothetical protein EMIHUDRAFT_208366 [Emiliania huxleyi CCMP1516]|eukprot:XP_005772918.1 hypothetical protein EMIHUDRAFT_208366 [Emiliania huxleyi CCMP1516]